MQHCQPECWVAGQEEGKSLSVFNHTAEEAHSNRTVSSGMWRQAKGLVLKFNAFPGPARMQQVDELVAQLGIPVTPRDTWCSFLSTVVFFAALCLVFVVPALRVYVKHEPEVHSENMLVAAGLGRYGGHKANLMLPVAFELQGHNDSAAFLDGCSLDRAETTYSFDSRVARTSAPCLYKQFHTRSVGLGYAADISFSFPSHNIYPLLAEANQTLPQLWASVGSAMEAPDWYKASVIDAWRRPDNFKVPLHDVCSRIPAQRSSPFTYLEYTFKMHVAEIQNYDFFHELLGKRIYVSWFVADCVEQQPSAPPHWLLTGTQNGMHGAAVYVRAKTDDQNVQEYIVKFPSTIELMSRIGGGATFLLAVGSLMFRFLRSAPLQCSATFKKEESPEHCPQEGNVEPPDHRRSKIDADACQLTSCDV
eukprot:TRINITY_DN28841_c0_g1_i1.p1 TRINITY_DN28841_c0_g1~~TRINITY_DN28841_c0_g1_i1.p1  ORF type:complete len:420 (+),score=48.44 TRINITY_DN28841_c0_g1_i1:139-1398(+)